MNGMTLDEMFPGTTGRLLDHCGGLSFAQIAWLISPPKDEYGKVLPMPGLPGAKGEKATEGER